MVTTEKRLTIMILDDEEDILARYSDLSNKGHRVLNTYVNADTILYDIDIEPPDVYITDYRLPGNKNWI